MENFADFKEPMRSQLLKIRRSLSVIDPYDKNLDARTIGFWVIEKATPEQRQKFHDSLKSALEKLTI